MMIAQLLAIVLCINLWLGNVAQIVLNKILLDGSVVVIFISPVLELGWTSLSHPVKLILLRLFNGNFLMKAVKVILIRLGRGCVIDFLSANIEIGTSKIRNVHLDSFL